MTLECLEPEDVLQIARVAVGGHVVVRNRFVLESAVGQPTMTMFGQDLYPNLAAKASALWYSIDHNQPLMDGNKRTAVLSATTFLELNGYRLQLDPDELYELALQVAVGTVKDTDELAGILRRSIKPC